MSVFLNFIASRTGTIEQLAADTHPIELAQMLNYATQEIQAFQKEKAEVRENLKSIETQADLIRFNLEASFKQWKLAHAAFKGAFDTPIDRRMLNNDFANDARKRINDFDTSLRETYPVFFKD